MKKNLPGPRSKRLLDRFEKLNGAKGAAYPFVMSGKGDGCYFTDIDGNRFLDFGSQICSNPLGYNHPAMNSVLERFPTGPVKYAGQDFVLKEHIDLLGFPVGTHAEFHACIRAQTEIKGAEIWICRIKVDGSIGIAKPCRFCRLYLIREGITRAHYTAEDGYSSMLLVPGETTKQKSAFDSKY